MMIMPRPRPTPARPPAAGRTRRARARAQGALAVMLGLGAAALVSCGGSSSTSLIPAQDAEPLQQAFRSVAEAAQAGDGNCGKTESAIERTEQQFQRLPVSVDRGLAERLHKGIENLRARALAQCEEGAVTNRPNTSTQTKTTPPPPPVQTTTTPPPPVTTEETHTTETQETPETTTQPETSTVEEHVGGVTVPTETPTVPETEPENGNAGGTKAEGNDGGTPVGPGGGSG
jgi:hypothetical protein